MSRHFDQEKDRSGANEGGSRRGSGGALEASEDILQAYERYMALGSRQEWREAEYYTEQECVDNLTRSVFDALSAQCDWQELEGESPNHLAVHCPRIRDLDSEGFSAGLAAQAVMEVTDRAGNWVLFDHDSEPYIVASPALMLVSSSGTASVSASMLLSSRALQEIVERSARDPDLTPQFVRSELRVAVREALSLLEQEVPLDQIECKRLTFEPDRSACLVDAGFASFLMKLRLNALGALEPVLIGAARAFS